LAVVGRNTYKMMIAYGEFKTSTRIAFTISAQSGIMSGKRMRMGTFEDISHAHGRVLSGFGLKPWGSSVTTLKECQYYAQ
jgi:hypothetical protein